MILIAASSLTTEALSLREVIIDFDMSRIFDRQCKLSVHNISRNRVSTAINLLLNGQPITFTVPSNFQKKNYYLTNFNTISSDMIFLARSCHIISSHIVILTRGTLMLYSLYITRSTTWDMDVLVQYLITPSIKCRQWCEVPHVVQVHVYNKTSKSQTCKYTIINMDTLSWVKVLQILTV